MASARLLFGDHTLKVSCLVHLPRPCPVRRFSSNKKSSTENGKLSGFGQATSKTYDMKFQQATQSSLPGIDAMSFIQAFKSQDHEFSHQRSRSLNRFGEESDVCMHGDYIKRDGPDEMNNAYYQSMSNVSLYSVMQTNVPAPYVKDPGHMNMPGSGIKIKDKVTAGQRNDISFKSYRSFHTAPAIHQDHDRTGDQGVQGPFPWLNNETIETLSKKENPIPQGVQGMDCNQFKLWLSNCTQYNMIECDQQLTDLREGRKTLAQVFEEQELLIQQVAEEYKAKTSKGQVSNHEQPCTQSKSNALLSNKDKMKQAVSQYGGTVIVFHVGISLISLGVSYLAVSSGLDVIGILGKLGVGQSILESRVAAGASTFVVAYAIHKVFAPVRIAITLTCTPFIVRHLRAIGFLKPAKPT